MEIINPLRFGFSEITIPYKEAVENDHYCIYECFSMQDVAFAILHYLFLNDYRLMKCEHCGKYFAKKEGKNASKTKYCPRLSPYIGYTGKTCGDAVDTILSKIKQRKERVYKYISASYPKAAGLFCEEYAVQHAKEKSVENLETLERILSEEYVKEKWYRKEYKQ